MGIGDLSQPGMLRIWFGNCHEFHLCTASQQYLPKNRHFYRRFVKKLIYVANISTDMRTALRKIKHVDVPVHFGSNEKLLKLTGFISEEI